MLCRIRTCASSWILCRLRVRLLSDTCVASGLVLLSDSYVALGNCFFLYLQVLISSREGIVIAGPLISIGKVFESSQTESDNLLVKMIPDVGSEHILP